MKLKLLDKIKQDLKRTETKPLDGFGSTLRRSEGDPKI